MIIGQWNIRSATKNRASLLNLIKTFQFQIICLSETWLKPDINFNINHYHTICKNRNDGYGGVAILAHVSVTFKTLNIVIPFNDIEYISILVSTEDQDFTVVSLYVPPGNIVSKEKWQEFFSSFPSPLIVVGDFNCHHQSWGSGKTNRAGEYLLDAIIESKLIVSNDDHPTTVTRPGSIPSIIDLTLVTDKIRVLDWQVYPYPCGSDHFPIIFQIFKCNSYHVTKCPSSKLQNGWKDKIVDWEQFEDKLYLKFLNRFDDDDFTSNNILQSYSSFMSDLTEIINQCMKKKIYIENSTIRFPSLPPWWTKECQELIDKRKKIYRNFYSHQSTENYILYKKNDAEVKKRLHEIRRQGRKTYLSQLDIHNMNKNWSVIRQYKKACFPVNKDNNATTFNWLKDFLNIWTPDSVSEFEKIYTDDLNFEPFLMFELEKII